MQIYFARSLARMSVAAILMFGLGNVASAAMIVVSPSQPNGWGGLVETGSGSIDYVAGPATPPLGTGSVQLTLDDPTSGVVVGTQAFSGVRLDSLTTLSYQTYNTVGNNLVAPALQFNLDYDLTDANTNWQGRLVFEPYLTGVPVVDGTWQTWDALAGQWWSTGAPVVGGTAVAETCTQASTCSIADILTLYPNAGVQTGPSSGVLFKAGSGWLAGYTGSVDAFSIGQAGGDVTTFDFEPDAAPVPVPPTLPLMVVALGVLMATRSRVR